MELIDERTNVRMAFGQPKWLDDYNVSTKCIIINVHYGNKANET